MHGQRSQWMAERAIVLQVLRDDRPRRWTQAELEHAISDLDPQTVRSALATLEAEGVVVVDGEEVKASRAARHLDAIELVSV
jgi:DNA-binding HxlR family transcriptional regulator